MAKLWGARFSGGLDPFFERFNRSLPFDHRLLEADLEGSRAWANALGRAGVLTDEEVGRITTAESTSMRSSSGSASSAEPAEAETYADTITRSASPTASIASAYAAESLRSSSRTSARSNTRSESPVAKPRLAHRRVEGAYRM